MKKAQLTWMCTFTSALLLFSCNAHFTILPYDGIYSLISVERDSTIDDTEIPLGFTDNSKLRIEVIDQRPIDLYGSDFEAWTWATYPTSEVAAEYYCWFFDDCTLANYDLRGMHMEDNKFVWGLVPNGGAIDTGLGFISFSFSWIDKTAGTIRIVVEFQSYTVVFEK